MGEVVVSATGTGVVVSGAGLGAAVDSATGTAPASSTAGLGVEVVSAAGGGGAASGPGRGGATFGCVGFSDHDGPASMFLFSLAPPKPMMASSGRFLTISSIRRPALIVFRSPMARSNTMRVEVVSGEVITLVAGSTNQV